MAYDNLKTRVAAVIKENGNREITGDLLQGVLLDIISVLGTGYQFVGVATPTTIPGMPDAKVFYLAFEPGTYPNFGGAVLASGIGVFSFDSEWHYASINLPSRSDIETAFDGKMSAVTANAEIALKADSVTPVVPPMVAGSARGILGRSAAARFLYRQTTSGSGAAWLKKIAGRTVSVNQLVQDRATFVTAGLTCSISGGKLTISGIALSTGIAEFEQISTIAGHKYILQTDSNIYATGNISANTIHTASITGPHSIRMAVTQGQAYNMVSSLCFTDLTQAGLDSIITTPELFEEWQMEQFGNKGYLAYTPGKLVSVNPTGLLTTTPGGDEHTLPLDFSEHFPNGLNGMNDVVDEVESDEFGKFTEGDVRFGIVDLGDLNWAYSNDVFVVDIDGCAKNVQGGGGVCTIYPIIDFRSVARMPDRSIGLGTSWFSAARSTAIVKDSAYTDAATFKTAMSGVMLVYPLATPQHVTFTDPSDAVYPVTEGGTEQVLPVNGSDPATIAPDITLQMPRVLGKDTPAMGSLDNLVAAVAQKVGKTITKVWDNETRSYQFEIQ